MEGVLVRFGEIGIKSQPVRRQMLQRLQQNLLDQILRRGLEGDVQIRGPRLWMGGPDLDALLDVATHTFGVVNASIAKEIPGTIDAVSRAAIALAKGDWTTFAIRASREGEHNFSSQDIGIQVGSAVFKARQAEGFTPKVNLSSPEFEIHVEVRDNVAYVFANKILGPGGLPAGSQGHVIALVDDGASWLAAWFMMRRGAKVTLLHAGDTGSIDTDNWDAFAKWGGPLNAILLPVCKGTVPKAQLMLAAQRLARGRKAAALVTGDGIESDLFAPPDMVVLRPMCGLIDHEASIWFDHSGITNSPGNEFLGDSDETVESLLSMKRIVQL